jgi:hypothetical protein
MRESNPAQGCNFNQFGGNTMLTIEAVRSALIEAINHGYCDALILSVASAATSARRGDGLRNALADILREKRRIDRLIREIDQENEVAAAEEARFNRNLDRWFAGKGAAFNGVENYAAR